MMRNARFWVYVNGGPVKLTLRPGQTLEHVSGGPTDEGWSRDAIRWSFDGETVEREWVDEGCDCDGRVCHCGSDSCPLGLLQDQIPYAADPYADVSPAERAAYAGVMYPSCGNRNRTVHDEFAEAAGY